MHFLIVTMEKKSIILELSCELIDKIDRLNSMWDRSAFVAQLLEKQIFKPVESSLTPSTELTTKMSETDGLLRTTQGLLDITNNDEYLHHAQQIENFFRMLMEISTKIPYP